MNDAAIDVTVITPAFNTERYLHRCVRSVLAERDVRVEYIVIDDGSTDFTGSILRQYEQLDPRVRVISKNNEGQGVARNVGIGEASGRYVYFLDSDDYISKPGSLSQLVRTADERNLDICSPHAPPHYFHRPHELISAIPTRMQFVARTLIEMNNIRQPDSPSGQDGVFGHLLLCHSARFGVCDQARIHYTAVRPGSTFLKYRGRPDLVCEIVRSHLTTIDGHYEQHNLWCREAPRFLSFLYKETLTNRVKPHWASLDPDERRKLAVLVQSYARKGLRFLPRSRLPNVHPTISAFANRSIDELVGGLPGAYFDQTVEEPTPSFDKVYYKKNSVHIRKRESGNKEKFESYLKNNSKRQDRSTINSNKLDFLINMNVNMNSQGRDVYAAAPAYLHRKKGDEFIVSMTTIPDRLNAVHLALEAIVAQDVRPSKIVLWLGDHFDFDISEFPRLAKAQEFGVDIRRVPDVGPHTKLVYALQEFGDLPIITADDDMIYPANAISILLSMAKKFPGAIIGNWVRVLRQDASGRVEGVRRGELLTPPHLEMTVEQEVEFNPIPTLSGFAYGTGGVLYPAGSLAPEVQNFSLMRELCPTEDDVWFKAMSLLNGTPVVPTNLGISPSHYCVNSTQMTALRHVNHGSGANAGQIRNVFSFFNLEPLMSAQAEAKVRRLYNLA